MAEDRKLHVVYWEKTISCYHSNSHKILRLEEQMDVLKRLDNGQSCRSVVIICGCEKQQIAQVCQQQVEIQREWASGGHCNLKYLKRRKTMYEDWNVRRGPGRGSVLPG